ncbi:MAG: NYN domain-containing protein [Oscillospiraceae bacterium]|nr:NYN domain-containing protein [Oscillospiraceae bacterium]
MAEEKKLALLIDSDNVSAKYAQFILQEASKYGELSCRRVYGDWEKNNTGWRIPAMNNSILPVQQTCYVTGKNATDFSMIIDAMDLLYSGNIDGFVLVTSDSDFTRLAIRLREAGKLVVGIGEVKTPLAFTSSCHHFSYLNQVCDSVGEYDEKSLRKAVLDFVKENDDKRLDLGRIDSFLTSRYGNIDFDLLGFKRLSNFIDSFKELRRNNTFVSMKKTTPPPAPVSRSGDVTERDFTAAVVDFLKTNGAERDNMLKIESHILKVFGKIDYSKFGSKRFAKVLDRIPEVVREGTYVTLAANAAPKSNMQKPELKSVIADALEYAKANMPDGGNLGQLNNMLLEKYGKGYVEKLGFSDFSAMMGAVDGVYTASNKVYIAEPNAPKTAASAKAAAVKEAVKDKNADKTFAEDKEDIKTNTTAKNAPLPAESDNEIKSDDNEKADIPEKPEKIEINAVKRDILSCAAQSENGISLPALGKILNEKYGKGYLKELGFGSMKKLVSEISGVSVKDNKLSIDEEFLSRTDEIEQFVFDFARGKGSRSIKALSSGIKKKFPGFDFADYGYAKFSDFINAIDGVRANGYYVEPDGN